LAGARVQQRPHAPAVEGIILVRRIGEGRPPEVRRLYARTSLSPLVPREMRYWIVRRCAACPCEAVSTLSENPHPNVFSNISRTLTGWPAPSSLLTALSQRAPFARPNSSSVICTETNAGLAELCRASPSDVLRVQPNMHV